MKVVYEWDIETVDEYGDIIDHNHFDSLPPLYEIGEGDRLVLVRDEGDEINGIQDRVWAYVDDAGNLPEYFQDSMGENTHKVPQRFHREIKKYKI